ncbi:EI24 domain-containing protein [Aurantiacibacter gilvus]|uniref:EI24 domain-containing protein n=1 Tax=Aurantiacibacter gilvus TaxID=3139141 RepID=A0ABU9IHG6_9SPHN
MGAFTTSLALGLRQLLDGEVLRVLLKSLGVTLVLFVLVATGGWFLLDWALASGGLEDRLFAGAGALRGALSLVLSLLGLWLTWRIVAMAVVQFYADEVVQAVERRHYPDEARVARELSFGEQMRVALSAAGRALLANLAALPFALVLLFTGVGTFLLFWLVNALLLGRELQDMVWLRHRHQPAEAAPVGKGERFLLGAAIAAMMAVPFANFLAPVLGAASATHLVHRNLRSRKVT